QINEDYKAMDVDNNVAPGAATIIIPPESDAATAPQVNEENKNVNNDEETVRKRKTSYAWTHFSALLVPENDGKHLAKCHHCPKRFGCHPTKHGRIL
ncbi:hypothetical protein PIB30_081368, partial [Stylosanthes scabra]|nr:hypothetical protein [Stylosanthes scabra]